ncbi:carotenoid ester lipase precursor [Polyporus arcularius HHB13444]|uniref:Carboxylic ester hydrolase n=1 Tax=Polyporus arcularius HHB13444 TaxID=1314778 RepID=A0A5C3PBD2_9APHY|nr:carotenoid ester lipase precursor [Polyporus arcularius HHB13444]
MVVSGFCLAIILQTWVVGALQNSHVLVQLDRANVVGTVGGSTENFLGLPYAQPPVGDLRLRLPELISFYNGTINATSFGNQCIQQAAPLGPNIPPEVLEGLQTLGTVFDTNPDVPQSEDCLNLNVIRPAHISPHEKLPVLFWIYGGAFADGSNAMAKYNGTLIVQRSIDIGEPVIWVAVNYRLHVFGFLGGREVKEAGIGNLGLQDQRTALRWVQRFIPSFGGDPKRVTIWGESAGSISVFFHLSANQGNAEGLFRAGIMSSGSSVPTGDITDADAQNTYDAVTQQVGCSNATDTLACLRTVPAESLLAAANNTPSANGFQGLAMPYMPHADGVFVTQPPQELVKHGALAHVPFIIGDVQDEGTLFSLGNLNITTDEELVSYLKTIWFPGASSSDIQVILKLYPSDPVDGSPFGTGSAEAFTPEYKRIAAIQGDLFFHSPRRQLLDRFSSTHATYSFLSARSNLSGIGYAHGTDLLNAFDPGDMTDYFIRFVRHLNPNSNSSAVHWPVYNASSRLTLQFNDGSIPLNITTDTERLSGTDALLDLSLRFPF